MGKTYNKRELLTNAFLVQLAFGIGCIIVLLFVSEGYNNISTIRMMPWFVRIFALASAVMSIVNLFLWQRSLNSQPKRKYLDLFLYLISFSLGCLYLLYFHKMIHMSAFFSRWMTETQVKQIFTTSNAMKSLFYIIGLYMLIAFVVYIIRYILCAKKAK